MKANDCSEDVPDEWIAIIGSMGMLQETSTFMLHAFCPALVVLDMRHQRRLRE